LPIPEIKNLERAVPAGMGTGAEAAGHHAAERKVCAAMRNKQLSSLNTRVDPSLGYKPGMKRADVRRAQKAYLKIRQGKRP
jgi:hypothetical protein